MHAPYTRCIEHASMNAAVRAALWYASGHTSSGSKSLVQSMALVASDSSHAGASANTKLPVRVAYMLERRSLVERRHEINDAHLKRQRRRCHRHVLEDYGAT